jgi:hypothetical protein
MSAEPSPVPAAPRLSRLTIATAVVFGLFYAYDVWEAFGNLLQLPQLYKANNIDTANVPWALLIAGVAAPIVIYAVALFVARRQRLLGRCIILFVGLAATAALSLAIIELPSLL